MEKEPEKLVEARFLLAGFEKLKNSPQELPSLSQAISMLTDLLKGNCSLVYKERGKQLLITYGERVLSRIKSILSNPDPYDPNDLKYWHNVMEQFGESGFFDYQEYEECKKQLLLLALNKSLFQGLSKEQLDLLIKELEKKATKQQKPESE